MPILSDTDITEGILKDQFVKDGDTEQVNGACYELRLGKVYYDLTEGDHPILVDDKQKILIKPGHRVVLITQEKLDIPYNFIAQIVSKGSLFSIGLSPAATYADPGFTGNIGIVTQNISDKYIVSTPLEGIAKIMFTKLSGDAERPYRGQHGFDTQIWPIKHQLQKSYKEFSHDSRVGTEKEEGYRLLPKLQ